MKLYFDNSDSGITRGNSGVRIIWCLVLIAIVLHIPSIKAFAQQRSLSEFGIEAGPVYRPASADNVGILGRLFYTAKFSTLDIEGGVIVTTVADDAFGFDVLTRFPIAASHHVVISMGLETLVWSNTVTIGVPLRIGVQLDKSGYIIEPSVGTAPSFTLTNDKNFMLFDLRIGIRF